MAQAEEQPRPDTYVYADVLAARAVGERKGERTRAAIARAVCHLLDRQSLRSLTVGDICKTAKIANGTFYLYFPDRNALVLDVLLGFVAYVQHAMRDAARSGHTDPIRASTAVACPVHTAKTLVTGIESS